MIFSVNQYVHHCRVELFELPFIEVGIKRPLKWAGSYVATGISPTACGVIGAADAAADRTRY